MIGLVTGGLQSLLGGYQAIKGGIDAKHDQRDLEALQTPTTTNDAAVSDYYNRASANPFDNLMYQMQRQNIGRSSAASLNALQGRHSAVLGANNIARTQDDALLKAGATAEQEQNRMLSTATKMKAADDNRVFGINKMLPYQKQFSLLGAKASAANKMANAGWSNIFGGFKTAAADGLSGGTGGDSSSMY